MKQHKSLICHAVKQISCRRCPETKRNCWHSLSRRLQKCLKELYLKFRHLSIQQEPTFLLWFWEHILAMNLALALLLSGEERLARLLGQNRRKPYWLIFRGFLSGRHVYLHPLQLSFIKTSARMRTHSHPTFSQFICCNTTLGTCYFK